MVESKSDFQLADQTRNGGVFNPLIAIDVLTFGLAGCLDRDAMNTDATRYLLNTNTSCMWATGT
jgi:hypothetical protein